ncbi:MAG: hypothetical protein KatS3mg091_319 [Patescibacteria group bacterium]|nr:MAG: hypothetical protein KatS3mg091_319 [Patescibacteria group bacterium]
MKSVRIFSNTHRQLKKEFAKCGFKLIKAKNCRSLLDLGCGDGRDSIYFANKGLKVTAVDFSKSGIEKLKTRQNRIKNRINCILKDIRNINFPENSFVVIYAHLSLHYFDDKTTSKIFDNLYKVLKKGGLIFVKCKSTDDALFGKGKKVGENMYKKGHVQHFFTKEYMTEKLKFITNINRLLSKRLRRNRICRQAR